MKSVKWLLLIPMFAGLVSRGDEWRKVAFIGDANVKSISGLVEEITGKEERVVHEKEAVKVGQTLRIWRGAEVVLEMKNSKSLVRAKGPVLLRLAPNTDSYDRAGITCEEPKSGFVVRAVRGHGKFQDGEFWRDLQTGMTIPDGAVVRPFRDSVLDFYHPATRSAYRVTDHTKRTTLTASAIKSEPAAATFMASRTP